MIGLAVAVALAAIVIAGLGFGIQAQSRTLNPRTVLALPADREAMPWLRDTARRCPGCATTSPPMP